MPQELPAGIIDFFSRTEEIRKRLFSGALTCSFVEKPEFFAQVTSRNNRYFLEVTSGLLDAIEKFWIEAHRRGALCNGLSVKCGVPNDYLPYLSLTWLMLHELSHIDLGHFKLKYSFGVAQRSHLNPTSFRFPLDRTNTLIPLCLELQADHEATDTLLGAYITDGWHELHQKVVAISGMMMLIELEDGKNGAGGHTHPKAATRIFQLFGHLAELPLIKAQIKKDTSLIPTEEELEVFARDVTIPCFFDAIQLAQVAGAASIADDLGSPEDFFKDLEVAKLGDPSRYGDLKTQGAQEWAKLWPCNEALKPILGGHFTN